MSLNIGFGICASFCTFDKIFKVMQKIIDSNDDCNIYPIMSYSASKTDTRFGLAKDNIAKIENICKNKVILDILVVAPCTGNTLGKITAGINDTPVTMALKAHLRNQRPVLIGVSTNDGLSTSAKNIGELLNRKNIYFIPMKQDDYINKPLSIVADFDKTNEAIKFALKYKQLQPII